jgi:hypothetical protein
LDIFENVYKMLIVGNMMRYSYSMGFVEDRINFLLRDGRTLNSFIIGPIKILIGQKMKNSSSFMKENL